MTQNRTSIGLRSKTRGLIYEGQHSNLNEAVATAIEHNIDLAGIDFAGQDLRGVNLDGVHLANANFTGCDLSGANMSEAVFEKCDFSQAKLFDACFCYSSFQKCDFRHSLFGMTDFAQASLRSCKFEGIGTLMPDFTVTSCFVENGYVHEAEWLPLSQPPIALLGFKQHVFFLDDKVLINNEVFNYERSGIAELTYRLYTTLISRKG